MTRWADETLEERVLLNPAFCANLLWQFGSAGGVNGLRRATFFECFVLLPMVLHAATREALPRTTRTSLSVWLEDNPTARGTIAHRARILAPFTKDALLFGGTQGLFHFEGDLLVPRGDLSRKVKAALRRSTDEVRACAKRAVFVGSWFCDAGTPTTVLALMGVRP
jgi:hypothetical protein